MSRLACLPLFACTACYCECTLVFDDRPNPWMRPSAPWPTNTVGVAQDAYGGYGAANFDTGADPSDDWAFTPRGDAAHAPVLGIGHPLLLGAATYFEVRPIEPLTPGVTYDFLGVGLFIGPEADMTAPETPVVRDVGERGCLDVDSDDPTVGWILWEVRDRDGVVVQGGLLPDRETSVCAEPRDEVVVRAVDTGGNASGWSEPRRFSR